MEFLRKVNVEYSQKIWEFCTKHSIPLAYASSAATYGAGEQGYADDESRMDRLKPLNPYGESKRLFDVWATEQEKKGNHPPSWSGHKFFNVYGFGERHKRGQASVVLHSYDQILASGGVRLFKSHREGIAHGHQSRDFIHVGDVIDILEFSISHPIRRGIYNVGTGKARTFLDLTRAVFRALGRPEQIEFIDTPEAIRERYQYFTQATTEKLRAAGYTRPFTSLEEGVKKTVAQLEGFSRRRN
jgi:ADP-L-glycero-D-manno-heptose 6-epimerase